MSLLQLLLVTFAFALGSCDGKWDIEPPIVRYRTTSFGDGTSTVFMSSRIWGWTGDHEETRLCSRSFEIGKDDKENQCLVLYSSEIYYRWDEPPKIKIYVYSSAVPKDHLGPIGEVKVVLVPIEKTRDIDATYLKRGLTRFAA